MENSHHRVYQAINNEENLYTLPETDLKNILSENSKVEKSLYAFPCLSKKGRGWFENIYVHPHPHTHMHINTYTYIHTISMNIFSYM